MKEKTHGFLGVRLIDLENHVDNRGSFVEIFSPEISSLVDFTCPPQVNMSQSKKNVFRGMHLQESPLGQAKLVVCVSGAITDFVLDVNPESQSFGEHISFEMDSGKLQALYLPPEFAHGFLSLMDDTKVVYLVGRVRHEASEITINPLSTSIRDFLSGRSIILSEKDRNAITLEDFRSDFYPKAGS